MPEEINRVVADHLSDLLFCLRWLWKTCARRGCTSGGLITGDVMYDASSTFRQIAESRDGPPADAWRPGEFALATVHHAENTDDPRRLRAIFDALDRIARTACPSSRPYINAR
jgi:UDP-GlcNAc3NAcA epimerase